MRIAMIGQKGIPTRFGGIERHVEELSTRLGAAGNEVSVYSRAWYTDNSTRLPKGVRTIITPTIPTKHLDAIVHTFTSTVHAMWTGVDVMHYHGVGPSLLSWIPRVFAPSIKVVATFHCEDWENDKWGPFASIMLKLGERTICTFPHKTITISEILSEHCESNYSTETITIPNGVNDPGTKHGTDALASFGIKPNEYIFIATRLTPRKGLEHLIEAFIRLKRADLTADKKLVIAGGHTFTTEFVEKLHDMADNDPDIIFTGNQTGETLNQLYAHSYACVHPSESEGLPIAVLEAMSHGKCVLGSDIPEVLHITAAVGLNHRTGDVDDLAQGIRFMIDHPEFIKKKGAEARKKVLAEYDWYDISRKVLALYQELCKKRIRWSAKDKVKA